MLSVLQEADYVLDACGRPLPPLGYKFVDLPRIIPFHSAVFLTIPPGTPAQQRIANNSKTLFICKGIMQFQTALATRIKWPSGRYFAQNPSFESAFPEPANPFGSGGNLLALDSPEPIPAGAKITIEMSGGSPGPADIHFWGVLRYLLKDDGINTPRLIDDPVAELKSRPRYLCGPPQNIMAPEWLLGNQCQIDTPAGYQDEAYTFFSPAIHVPIDGQSYNNAVIVPGSDDVIVRRFRAISVHPNPDVGDAEPTFSLRLPNGYSITGGDQVPTVSLFWWPVFPGGIRIPGGQRIIIDMADLFGFGTGEVITTFEFDSIKRRKVGS
jgi:hypothetical protein